MASGPSAISELRRILSGGLLYMRVMARQGFFTSHSLLTANANLHTDRGASLATQQIRAVGQRVRPPPDSVGNSINHTCGNSSLIPPPPVTPERGAISISRHDLLKPTADSKAFYYSYENIYGEGTGCPVVRPALLLLQPDTE
ncbi:hypothetical protein JZ751_004023 [Albula glossodonta]|uniref:Uncharacterized protein n=1 Tax=Albula glossodonta TaxID=121402 RepID=A0A8T2P647_9TELE|nr:hypothetical protein JZ751_004023 [Albula glossodonta]